MNYTILYTFSVKIGVLIGVLNTMPYQFLHDSIIFLLKLLFYKAVLTNERVLGIIRS